MRRIISCLILLLPLGLWAQISSKVLVVKTASTAPDSIVSLSNNNKICPGTNTQLSLSGGVLGDDAQWLWFTDGCATGTSIGSGPTLSVMPTSNSTDYYVSSVGGCNTVCAMINILWDSAGCNTLPVKLLRFDAQLYKQDKGLITWETVDEEPNTGYDLLKSADGSNFEFLYHKDANGIHGINNYSFIDNNLLTGNNFYRLKMIYPDQSIAYSDIKNIRYSKGTESVSLYPNPTDGFIYFEFNANENEHVELWITNIIGQRFNNRVVVNTVVGKNIVKMQLSDLAAGAYLFHYLNAKGNVQTIKFIKKL